VYKDHGLKRQIHGAKLVLQTRQNMLNGLMRSVLDRESVRVAIAQA